MKTACTGRLAFLKPRVLIGFALYAAGPALAFGIMSSAAAGDNTAAELNQPAQAPGRWIPTGDLTTTRVNHTATLLPTRQVLVAGGGSRTIGGLLASAELYDPATGMWSLTGRLSNARRDHTATLLQNGQVLVAGGRDTNVLASAELYDPATGMWTGTGLLATARIGHTATLLQNGQVLVAGGTTTGIVVSSAELYDPASGNWRATVAWSNHTLTTRPLCCRTGRYW
jgi:large repetitive protein